MPAIRRARTAWAAWWSMGSVLRSWACSTGGLPKLLALVKVPALADNASLGLVFLVGLLTSTHCIGMCGGILLAQTTDARGVTARSKRGLIASAAYNGGRVVSYTAVGALVLLVFSLGTVPLLFLFGALQSFLPRGWMKYIVKGSAVLVVTLGLSMLVKGIRLFGM